MKCCNRNTPRVLEVGCCDAPTLFHKVIIPASIGDETTMPPRNGAYRNALVEYDASGEVYFYSSDGIPTHISGDLDKLKELIEKAVAEEAAARDAADKKLAKDIEDEALTRAEAITELANQLLGETNARADGDRILDGKIETETRARGLADNEIWAEINMIEMASDVVDIVGTYAALQAYDTSHLQDNDIIKVLKDETHSNATTYYRWNKTTSQFSYVGEEGPYYTTSQTDQLLAGKQDALTAGTNVQISNNVISATDTTYTAGAGITIDSSNVISSTVVSVATLYVGSSSNEYRFYYDSAKTEQVTYQEMAQLLEAQNVRLVQGNNSAADVVAYSIGTGEIYIFSYDSGMYRSYRWFSSNQYASLTAHYLQDALSAGDNITISGHTISATDTTYTAGTGLSLTGTEFAVDTTVIAEKSDIPTVNDATLTVTQNGTSVGTFTANASSDVTIALTDTTYSAFTGTDGTAAGTAGLVPAPATTDAGKFLKADGTWGTAGGAANNINSSDWSALWQ